MIECARLGLAQICVKVVHVGSEYAMRALVGFNVRNHLAIYPIVLLIFLSQLCNNIWDNVEQIKAREAKGSLAEDGVAKLRMDNKLENEQIKVKLDLPCFLAIAGD